MKFKLKTLSGEEIEIEMDENCTVSALLQEACQRFGKSSENSMLIFQTRKLTVPEQKLSEINYQPGKFIIFHTVQTKSTNQQNTNSAITTNNEEAPSEPAKKEQISEEEQKRRAEAERQENFNRALENITAMGFSADHAQEALRIAEGNQNAALNIILNRRLNHQNYNERRIEEQRVRRERRRNAKKIRLSPSTSHSQDKRIDSLPGFKIAADRKFTGPVIDLYSDFIRNNEQTMERLNRIIQEQSLELMDSIQQNPSPMVSMLGFAVQSNEISGIQTAPYTEIFTEPLLKALNLSPEDVPIIKRLIRTGAPLHIAVRAFQATHNETIALSLLRNRFS